jgi:hypothetical protein
MKRLKFQLLNKDKFIYFFILQVIILTLQKWLNKKVFCICERIGYIRYGFEKNREVFRVRETKRYTKNKK